MCVYYGRILRSLRTDIQGRLKQEIIKLDYTWEADANFFRYMVSCVLLYDTIKKQV